jgi:glycine betaine/choline ABC-type transport system substrate-binding protein
MRRLNYEVDGLHRSPEAVAREFLRQAGLLSRKK